MRGRLVYLNGLTSQLLGTAEEAICPICQGPLQAAYGILICGHTLCYDCVHALFRLGKVHHGRYVMNIRENSLKMY